MAEENTPTSDKVEELLPLDDQGKIAKGLTEGAEKPPVEGAGEEATPKPAPTPRVYSEEEWNKRQSSIDKQMSEATKTHREELAQIQLKLEQKQDEDFIKRVQAEGGDVDAAKTIVGREQVLRQQARELEARQQAFQAETVQAFEVLKRNDAEKFARQYGVDDVDSLLKAGNPVEMELIASRLALEKAKTKAKPAIKTDSGLSSGKGADWSKLTPEEKIARGLEGMAI